MLNSPVSLDIMILLVPMPKLPSHIELNLLDTKVLTLSTTMVQDPLLTLTGMTATHLPKNPANQTQWPTSHLPPDLEIPPQWDTQVVNPAVILHPRHLPLDPVTCLDQIIQAVWPVIPLQEDTLLRTRIVLLLPVVAETRIPVLLLVVVTLTDPTTPTRRIPAVVDTMKVALIVEAPLTVISVPTLATMMVITILATDTN